jgi:ribonuclease HI
LAEKELTVGDELKQVIIYTDGGAVPNPGAGAYGVVLRFGQHRKELSGGFQRTTNNRMELMAVIVGLEALKERCRVTLHSDSQCIVNAVTSGAAFRWRNNGWGMNRSGSKKAKNADLWERLLAAVARRSGGFDGQLAGI